MARNEIHIDAPPEAVWHVLAQARWYAVWVFGSSRIRGADPDWPAPGTRFDHTIGVGPLRINDHTESLEAEAPVLLRLRAHARPLPAAEITLRLVPEDGGTRVIMIEDIESRPVRLALWGAAQPSTWLRNAESLRRLRGLVQGRAPSAASA